MAKYNSQFHDDWAWSLAVRGATDEEIAAAFHVSRITINRWQKVSASFAEALKAGKDAADAAVEKKLFERCIGYTYIEEQKIVNTAKDGNAKIEQTKTIEKHVPPDIMAIMYWLNNRKRNTGEWSTRQNVNFSTEKEQNDVIIYLPDNGRGPAGETQTGV